MRRELHENFFTGCRRAGEDHFVRARSDGEGGGGGGFGQQRDELRIKTSADDEFAKRLCRRSAANAGLE